MDRKLCSLHSLATIVSARELHRPSRIGAECSITGQWQVPNIFIFVMNTHCKNLGRSLKLIMPKYRPDPVSHLEDIPERYISRS